MDFKGDFKLSQGRCFPLTILDDHSRFAIALEACSGVNKSITQTELIKIFRRYACPYRSPVTMVLPGVRQAAATTPHWVFG